MQTAEAPVHSLETPMGCAVTAMARNVNIFEAVFSSK